MEVIKGWKGPNFLYGSLLTCHSFVCLFIYRDGIFFTFCGICLINLLHIIQLFKAGPTNFIFKARDIFYNIFIYTHIAEIGYFLQMNDSWLNQSSSQRQETRDGKLLDYVQISIVDLREPMKLCPPSISSVHSRVYLTYIDVLE